MKIPIRPKDELERLALELTPEGAGLFDGRSLRVEALITAMKLTPFPISGLSEVAEAYIPYKRGFIFIDEDQYLDAESHRCRFTFCEEIAHEVLHRPLFDGMSVADAQQAQAAITDEQYMQIESEAKYMASCLLMRPAWFTDAFMRLYAQQREKCPNELATLRYVVRQLGYTFNVSWHAAATRARIAGFIDKYQLEELIAIWQ